MSPTRASLLMMSEMLIRTPSSIICKIIFKMHSESYSCYINPFNCSKNDPWISIGALCCTDIINWRDSSLTEEESPDTIPCPYNIVAKRPRFSLSIYLRLVFLRLTAKFSLLRNIPWFSSPWDPSILDLLIVKRVFTFCHWSAQSVSNTFSLFAGNRTGLLLFLHLFDFEF